MMRPSFSCGYVSDTAYLDGTPPSAILQWQQEGAEAADEEAAQTGFANVRSCFTDPVPKPECEVVLDQLSPNVHSIVPNGLADCQRTSTGDHIFKINKME